MKVALFSVSAIFCWTTSAHAAIPAAAPVPRKILRANEAISGGNAGNGFSLNDVSFSAKSGKERLVIDIGDLQGHTLKGFPGYYHAELQSNPRRLILDFSQMPNVRVDEKTLRDKLKRSTKVASSSIILDPTDETLSLILDLRREAVAEVYQVAGQKGTARVVVDLR